MHTYILFTQTKYKIPNRVIQTPKINVSMVNSSESWKVVLLGSCALGETSTRTPGQGRVLDSK